MRPLAMETAVQRLANDAPLQREIPAAPQVVRSVDRPTQRAMVKNHPINIVSHHGVVRALRVHRLVLIAQAKTHVTHHHVMRLFHLKRIVAQRDPIARRGLPRNRHKRFVEQQCALQQNRPRHLEHDRPRSLRRPDPFAQRPCPRIRQRRDVVNISAPPALRATPKALRPRKRRQLRRASRPRKPSAQHQGISKKAGNSHSQINCPPSHRSPVPARAENNISGSSLFPMGEQTKPILSFGGIDRSWASSRDESLRERLRLIVSARGFLGPAHRRQVIAVCDQQTPPLTPETISRRAAPTFRHLAKLISDISLDIRH